MKHSLAIITIFAMLIGMQACFLYSFLAALTGEPDNVPGFIGLAIFFLIIGYAGYEKNGKV